MDGSSPLVRLETWLRSHPFRVDVGIAVLSVVLGGVHGVPGTASVLGMAGEVVVDVPWLQVAAVIAVATVAGLPASVLPARRAVHTPPVAASAD